MTCNCLNSTIHATSSSPLSSADDYSGRSQWLRAAILGANDGLISVSSLMIGVGAVNQSSRTMLISGFAGLVAGAFSMAIGEFLSVYAQYDIESAKLKRDINGSKEGLPSPWKAAAASFASFALGAVLPLLAGGFIRSWAARVAVVGLVSSMGLAAFGAAGAIAGGASVWKAAGRVLVGGWVAMLVTFGILRLCGFAFNINVSSAG